MSQNHLYPPNPVATWWLFIIEETGPIYGPVLNLGDSHPSHKSIGYCTLWLLFPGIYDLYGLCISWLPFDITLLLQTI
ncbi:putative pyridine nucleotide-disulfide oxidoreductase [Paenibacillus phage Tadhana]|uniref:Putative pyridine nucleotide-disulfide oxidoreductase n=3 Tax=Fernvirus TaxID=2843380 RepID=A0A2I7SCZ8_9CAUD|nr:putative pyridine nucleotide-disulfide oxidoreductase [Paenibacillus phage BN12]YP_009836439.1 putative pyridine nucleotide-disulfide oxidoreductase [Paenibacillus phage Pagassa]YP_009836509.1 putative pyridine nucleotide-disulfide oxidoreductase [Paenibacillus phage Tadhana]AUS03624.1 putative pyridine nucleotide-disulfide oxidoreductase [Paenibacillus phage BN12]AUS03757.1 putative pyridine nucleotide-disulfide oxidoreductase [Paenibacillus phage Pagassa]AUS03822.1 putative pyridine nucle